LALEGMGLQKHSNVINISDLGCIRLSFISVRYGAYMQDLLHDW